MSYLKRWKASDLPANYSKLHRYHKKQIRELYAELQKGNCYYCGKPLVHAPSQEVTSKVIHWSLFPKDFLKYPVHLHHCHTTDKTIGAVHAYCNAVLWQYEGK